MKTLIFNGSPRKNGDTVSLIDELTDHLDGEVRRIDAYDCDVRACIDCRYCWKHDGCSQKDGMQEIYDLIQEADNIVIASPMHFSEISGRLLAVLSRIQTYWSARFFRKIEPVPKNKRGAVIVVGGGDLPVKKAEDTANVLLRDMNARSVRTVYSHNTNERPSRDDQNALAKIRQMALTLNGESS